MTPTLDRPDGGDEIVVALIRARHHLLQLERTLVGFVLTREESARSWSGRERGTEQQGIGGKGTIGIGPDAPYAPDAFPPLQRRRKIGVLAVLMTAPRYFRTRSGARVPVASS